MFTYKKVNDKILVRKEKWGIIMKNSRERIKKLIVQALLVVMATGCINLNPVKVSSETKEAVSYTHLIFCQKYN